MKVEFTAPEILEGESINSHLVQVWVGFFFSPPPFFSGTEENVNEPRAVLKVLAGLLFLLAQTAASVSVETELPVSLSQESKDAL